MSRRLFGWESPRPRALMRIGLGLVLLWYVLQRWPYVVELYSTAGMPMPLFPNSALEPPAFSPAWAVALYALLVFSLAAIVVGCRTRTSLVLAFVLVTWFGWLDFGGTYKKYSAISQHLLLLLTFTRSHAVWSVDAVWDSKRANRTQLSPVWPRLLMQVLVSCVYVGAAVTKIRMPEFGTGDLLTFSMLDVRAAGGWLGMWMSTKPALMMFLSNLTTLFEFTVVTLLWVPGTRRIMLLTAMGFHLSLGLLLHLEIFSPVMIVALLAFVRESDLASIGVATRRALGLRGPKSVTPPTSRRNARLISYTRWGWYFSAAGTCVAMGFAQQYLADDTGVLQGTRTPVWNELDAHTADHIRNAASGAGKLKPADYFHRFDIGSRRGYPLLFGRRTVFHPNDLLYAQARVLQRHPEIQLVWVLRNPDGEFSETVRSLKPWFSHAVISYRLSGSNMPPGEYTLILEADGEEVARRKFRLEENE